MNGKGCTLSTRRDAPLPPNWLIKRCHGEGKRAFLPSYLHSRLSQYSLSHFFEFHFKASEAIRGSVMHLIRLVFSHLVGSYLLYWHNCGVVTNSRQPTLPGRVFQLSYSGGVAGTNSRVPLRVDSPTPFTHGRSARSGWTNSWNTAKG